MYPTLYETPGGVGIHTYGMFIVLALSSAFLLVNARAARVGFHPDKLIVNYLAAAVGGILGARLLYVLAVVGFSSPVVLWLLLALGGLAIAMSVAAGVSGWSSNQLMVRYAGSAVGVVVLAAVADAAFPGDRPSLFALAATFANELFSTGQGGFAYYGGVIGGAVAVLFTCSLMGLNGWKAADLAAPAVVLGYGVGRFGCFFAGCCHGVVAPVGEDPIALLPDGLLGGQLWLSGRLPFLTSEFHTGVGGIHDIPLYPTQLWQSASGFLLAGFLAWFWKHRRFDGQVAAVALIIEPPFRAFAESFRADHRGYAFTFEVSPTVEAWLPGLTQAGEAGAHVMGLTTSQGLGFAAMILGVVLLVARRGAVREPEVDLQAQEEANLDELLAD